MRIGAILRRWIEILAALYLAWCESRRERRSLVVTRENGHVVVRDAMLRDARAGNIVATLLPGAEVSADVPRAVHNSFVILEFPADKVVIRRITVPAQARKFLPGVIRNQIERLSPWPANAKLRTVRRTAVAPPAAFLDASTQGLASAQLQSYLAQLADDQRASLASSGREAGKRDDAPDTIRLQATLDMNLKALRAFLYHLESGTPYLFVDALTVQPAGAMAGRAVEDPLLRTTLSSRAFWRRGTP